MYNFYKDKFEIDIVQLLYNKLKERNLHTIELSQHKLPIIIECFEADGNKAMGKLTDLPIIRLMKEWDGDQAASLLEEIATYAHGIGPRQDLWGSKKFRDEAKRLKL